MHFSGSGAADRAASYAALLLLLLLLFCGCGCGGGDSNSSASDVLAALRVSRFATATVGSPWGVISLTQSELAGGVAGSLSADAASGCVSEWPAYMPRVTSSRSR